MLESELFLERHEELWLMEELRHIMFKQKEIKEKGIEALQWPDKDKGIDWANVQLQGTLDFFIARLKQTIPEKEFIKYLKQNSIKE